MIRQTVARVDLDAIRSNLQAIAGFLNARAGIIAVVKANAYGHGSAQVALALEDAGAAMLAVADIEEGIADVIISKHRNGGLATVELTFQKEYPRFMSYVGDDRY